MPKNYEKMSMEELLAWIDAQINEGEAIAGRSSGNTVTLPGALPASGRYQTNDTSVQGISPEMSYSEAPGMDQNAGGIYNTEHSASADHVDAGIESEDITRYNLFGKESLDLNSESLLKGILFSEILGKPRARRPIRFRSRT